ncbi:hypothetical protein YC2023_010600 [Brassica napus]
MNRALDASNQDARMAQFRAETADNEIARLKDELECSRPSERGSLRQRFIVPIGEDRERWLKLGRTVVTGSRACFGSIRGVIKLSRLLAKKGSTENRSRIPHGCTSSKPKTADED